ncbi:hypothetical protein SSBG_05335 [Streptomyces sp. SPB074]|nr:hypothetical protein SSBG_05335 [Streptomyces sp. SPB074]
MTGRDATATGRTWPRRGGESRVRAGRTGGRRRGVAASPPRRGVRGAIAGMRRDASADTDGPRDVATFPQVARDVAYVTSRTRRPGSGATSRPPRTASRPRRIASALSRHATSVNVASSPSRTAGRAARDAPRPPEPPAHRAPVPLPLVRSSSPRRAPCRGASRKDAPLSGRPISP